MHDVCACLIIDLISGILLISSLIVEDSQLEAGNVYSAYDSSRNALIGNGAIPTLVGANNAYGIIVEQPFTTISNVWLGLNPAMKRAPNSCHAIFLRHSAINCSVGVDGSLDTRHNPQSSSLFVLTLSLCNYCTSTLFI